MMSVLRRPGIFWSHPGGGGCVPLIDPGYPVLGLPMVVQGPCRQFQISLGEAERHADTLLVGITLPRHPKVVVLYRVDPKCSEILTSYSHRLGHIFA